MAVQDALWTEEMLQVSYSSTSGTFMWHFQSKLEQISLAEIAVRWVQKKEKTTYRISVVHSKTVMKDVLAYSGLSRIWYYSVLSAD